MEYEKGFRDGTHFEMLQIVTTFIAHTIFSWPNLKTMANDSYFHFDDSNEITYRYPQKHWKDDG